MVTRLFIKTSGVERGTLAVATPQRQSEDMLACLSLYCEAAKGIVGDEGYEAGGLPLVHFFSEDVFAGFQRQHGFSFAPQMLGCHVCIKGIDFNLLVGKHFAVGGASFRGISFRPSDYWERKRFSAEVVTWLLQHPACCLTASIVSSGLLALRQELRILP